MQRKKSWIKSELRKRGIRLTRQRESLVDHLINQATPKSAEEIFRELKDKKVSLTTIYRNIELLKQIGVIEELALEGGEFKYIINYYSGHWHHVVCTNCGFTRQIQPCPLNYSEIRKAMEDFDITGHRWEVYGICVDCKEK